MTNYADEQWDEIAQRWRKAAGQNDAIRFDAPAFVRWLKQAGHIKDYVCVPDADLTSEGKYEPDEGRLYFRVSTWDGASAGNPHHTWTVAHEGCHVVLKHKETRLRASVRQFSSRQTSHDEADAHRLTASLIAPFDKADFSLDSTLEDVQSRFGLSRAAAARRLEELQRMFRRKHGISRPLPPGVVDFLAAQKRKGYPVTSLDNVQIALPRDQKKYEGDPCPTCCEFALVRNGLRMTCDHCGARTGDD
jgi:hypothetical protein